MKSYGRPRRQRVMGIMFFLVLIMSVVSFYSVLAFGAEEQASARVTGETLFPDGSAPRGVTVYLNPGSAQKMLPASVPQQLQTTLAKDGSFTFPNVPVWRLGWALRVKGEGIVAPPEYRLRLTVRPGEEVKREITVYRGGTVSGRVTSDDGKPVKGARISFGEQDPPVETTSRADGSYRLSPVMPGERYVICETKDHILAGRQAAVKEQKETKGIDFTLKRAGFIIGQVVMPDGATPAPWAHVGLDPIGEPEKFRGAILGARAQQDGSFRTPPEPPGVYRLTATWPVGKMMKVTHRAAVARVVVQQGKETKVTVKLEAIQ